MLRLLAMALALALGGCAPTAGFIAGLAVAASIATIAGGGTTAIVNVKALEGGQFADASGANASLDGK